eukprot:394237_1
MNNHNSRNYDHTKIDDNGRLVYVFYKYNTLLNLYFSPKEATKIKSMFESIIFKLIVLISLFAYCFVQLLFVDYRPIYSIPFSCFIWIPYFIYIILSINITALKLITKTFNFWLRLSLSTFYFIAIWLDNFKLHYDQWKYLFAEVIERVLFGITVCLGVICISCYDGLAGSRGWKALFTLLFAIVAAIWSIFSLFAASNDDYYSLLTITPHFVVSLISIQFSTMSLLAISLVHQLFQIYRRKTSPWPCLLIRSNIYITWTEQTSQKQEKSDIENRNITIELVKNIYEKQLIFEDINNQNAIHIINILGGTEKVISNYTNQKRVKWNQQQLNEMYELITDSQSNDKIHLVLSTKDSLLNKIFNERINNILETVFHSKTGRIVFCSSIFIYIICASGARFFEDTNVYYRTFLSIQIGNIICIAIPYTLFFTLSMNGRVFRLISKTFIFWLLMIYAIGYLFCAILSLYIDDYSILTIICQFVVLIWYLLCIIIVSSLDALNLRRKWRLIVLTPICLITTLWTLFLMFRSMSNKDERDSTFFYISVSSSVKIPISLLMLEINVIRVVAIFLCKQLISSLSETNKATSIHLIPKIEWDPQNDGINTININNNKPIIMEKDNSRSGRSTLLQDIELASSIPTNK